MCQLLRPIFQPPFWYLLRLNNDKKIVMFEVVKISICRDVKPCVVDMSKCSEISYSLVRQDERINEVG